MGKRKVVFVAHCLLNQFIRAKGVRAFYREGERIPGVVKPLLSYLMEKGVGIEQLPCPELLWEGLDRPAAGLSRYDNASYRETARQIAQQVANTMKEYEREGIETVAVIGVNGSPSCGVAYTSGKLRRMGIFMEILREEVAKAGLKPLFLGLSPKRREELERVKEKLERALRGGEEDL